MNFRNIAVLLLVAALGGAAGFAVGMKNSFVKPERLAACANDKFVAKVAEAEGYLAMYPEKALRELLAEAPMGDAEKKEYSDSLDYAVAHPEGAAFAAFAECLNTKK